MMIQGHTIDFFLTPINKDYNFSLFYLWNWFRGMTAPIFLFTSGTVFVYLFRINKIQFSLNPRVTKGMKRFFLLLTVGYLLRLPSFYWLDLIYTKPQFWLEFYGVDILQLIGSGIFLLIIFEMVSSKLRINHTLLLIITSGLILVLHPFSNMVNWKTFLPIPLAAYLYSGTGSLFPLFPWLAFIFSGGAFGSYLAQNKGAHLNQMFLFRLAAFGLGLIVYSQVADNIEVMLLGKSYYWQASPNLTIFRLGFVLILNSIFGYLYTFVKSVPSLIILIGQNTLLIYVAHLIILYRISALETLKEHCNTVQSILLALVMIILMILLLYIVNFTIKKFKIMFPRFEKKRVNFK